MRVGLGGRGRHYVESSGSDLMVFFSVLLDVRCVVPFSEDDAKHKRWNRQHKNSNLDPHGKPKS